MITIEQLEEALGDDNKSPYKTKNVDHTVMAITLLRERIPYDVCKGIVGGSEHDVLYLCDVDKCLPYLTEEDLAILADCNVWYSEDNGCLAIFT